jgi:hexosaminidase
MPGTAGASPALVPWPASVVEGTGYAGLTASGRIIAENSGLLPLANVLAQEIYLRSALEMQATPTGSATANDIVLRLDDTITEDEGYRITVDGSGIVVGGKTYRGVAWGTSTLLQAIETGNGNPTRVPYLSIVDHPVGMYRGLLIDVARQWHPVESMRPLIEMCRLYKINYLQLHLNDQQSTVFPFLAYPELASVVSGQRRTWTRQEVVDLVKYADDRGVTLVPELEGPGHHSGNLRNLWGRGSTLDVFNENTYTGMNVLIGELCDVFASSPYIHLGGDEGSFGGLGASAEELAYMATQGITGNALSHYITRVDQIIKNHGKHTICWEGFGGDGGGSGVAPLPKDILVMPYESTFNPANNLVAKGFNVINTAWRPMYVVGSHCWSAEFIHDWNMWLWQHHVNLNLHIQLPIGSPSVLGAQMCAWEQVADVELPSTRIRAHAMAERTWNPYATNTYADFATRAEQTDALLDHVLARVDVQVDGASSQVVSNYAAYGVFLSAITVHMNAPAIGSIHYTTDGTTPTASSPLYSGPFTLTGADTHYEQLFYNKQSGNYGAQGYVINLQACLIDANGQPIGDMITLTHYWYQGAEIAVAAAGLSGNTVGDVAMFLDPITVTLTASGPGVIRYTLNGGEPTATSPIYSGPLVLNAANCVVQGVLWNRARGQYDWFAPAVILRAHLFSATGGMLPGLTAKATYWNTSPDLPQPDQTAPSVPASVTATVLTSRSVLLTWSAATDNLAVTGYRVYRDGSDIAAVSGTTYTDTTLEGGTTYQYTIKARDGTGNTSVESVPVSATTPPVPTAGTTVLAAESFDDTPGTNLNNLNGGSGWGGPWLVGSDSAYPATIQPGNLSNYSGLVSTANHLKFWSKGNGTTYQTLSRPFAAALPDAGQSIWLAMAVALYDSKDAATWTLTGLTSDADGLVPATLFSTTSMGAPTPFKFGNVTLFTGDTNYAPHLVLVRIGMSGDANAESVTAYVDPDLAADPGTWIGVSRSIYANGGLTGFAYNGGRNGSSLSADVYMDEIRLADGWQVAVGQAVSPPDNTPPTAAITSPANGTTYDQGDTITLNADAADSDGTVARVEFFQGTVKLGEDTAAPYSYVWTNVPAGSYSLTTKATDNEAAVTTSSVIGITVRPPPDGEPPTIPQNLAATATSTSTINLTWTASTDNIAVTGYNIYRDDVLAGISATANFADTGLTASTFYSYTIKAKDAAGNQSAASAGTGATTLPPTPSAGVLAEETFDGYTAGADISGKSGGTGWTGNWAVTKAGMDTLVSGNVNGLGTGNSLAQSYNSTTPQAGRTFAAINNSLNRTLWLAFELQATKVKLSQTFTLSGTGITGAMITITGSNSWIAPIYQFFGTTVVTPATTAAQLFVVRIEITGGGGTTLACYVNPDLAKTPDTPGFMAAATSSQTITAITGIVFRSNGNSASQPDKVNLDNIRLASTWQGAVGLAPTAAIETWRQMHFGTTGNTGNAADDADPNHNGIVNLLEYALGGDPLGHTTGTGILPQAERSAGNTLQLHFTRYLDRSDLKLTAQAADSPGGPWTDLAASTAGAAFAPAANAAESGTGNTRSVIVCDLYPMGDPAHPKRFMRLKVER